MQNFFLDGRYIVKRKYFRTKQIRPDKHELFQDFVLGEENQE